MHKFLLYGCEYIDFVDIIDKTFTGKKITYIGTSDEYLGVTTTPLIESTVEYFTQNPDKTVLYGELMKITGSRVEDVIKKQIYPPDSEVLVFLNNVFDKIDKILELFTSKDDGKTLVFVAPENMSSVYKSPISTVNPKLLRDFDIIYRVAYGDGDTWYLNKFDTHRNDVIAETIQNMMKGFNPSIHIATATTTKTERNDTTNDTVKNNSKSDHIIEKIVKHASQQTTNSAVKRKRPEKPIESLGDTPCKTAEPAQPTESSALNVDLSHVKVNPVDESDLNGEFAATIEKADLGTYSREVCVSSIVSDDSEIESKSETAIPTPKALTEDDIGDVFEMLENDATITGAPVKRKRNN